ncbi:hypothetical protein [Streptomyces sp. NPDC002671]
MALLLSMYYGRLCAGYWRQRVEAAPPGNAAPVADCRFNPGAVDAAARSVTRLAVAFQVSENSRRRYGRPTVVRRVQTVVGVPSEGKALVVTHPVDLPEDPGAASLGVVTVVVVSDPVAASFVVVAPESVAVVAAVALAALAPDLAPVVVVGVGKLHGMRNGGGLVASTMVGCRRRARCDEERGRCDRGGCEGGAAGDLVCHDISSLFRH